MRIRRLAPPDRDPIQHLLRTAGTFTDEEVAVAMELVDGALGALARDYRILVCEGEGEVILGYVCYGPTPMTNGTWDLYWIAAHAAARGRGVGTRLVQEMEAELSQAGARIVRIETSQLDEYEAARSFYARLSYREVGRIRDFYRHGDDLVTLAKCLNEAPAKRGVRRRVERQTDA
jgi:ribosomal protein S18 acetylase RimI-like enzyme